MHDQTYGAALQCQAPQHLADGDGGGAVQSAERLVQEEHRRVLQQRPGNGDLEDRWDRGGGRQAALLVGDRTAGGRPGVEWGVVCVGEGGIWTQNFEYQKWPKFCP